jgi:hypothetical protein
MFYYDSVWEAKFQKLLDFSNQHGHMFVLTENRELAYFCDMCRLHYRYFYGFVKNDNRTCILNEERIHRLNDIGFEWNVLNCYWNMRFQQLVNFSSVYGHCNVPIPYSKIPHLGDWVAEQRLTKRHIEEFPTGGHPTTVNCHSLVTSEAWEQRVAKLESIGFDWDPFETNWRRSWEQLRDFWKEHDTSK